MRIDEYQNSFSSIDAIKDTATGTLIGQRVMVDLGYKTLGTMIIHHIANNDGSYKLAMDIRKKYYINFNLKNIEKILHNVLFKSHH